MSAPILNADLIRAKHRAAMWMDYMDEQRGQLGGKSVTQARAQTVADLKERYAAGEVTLEAFEARLDAAFRLRL